MAMIKLNDFTLYCNWDKSKECKNGFHCGMCKYQPDDDDKPNGRKPPIKIRYQNDYGMMMPYCPACGDMAYSHERCVFCGQKFITEEAPRNKKEIIGATEGEDGTLTCDKCGAHEAMTLISHTDGEKFFSYDYRCQCGNEIRVKTLLGEFE